MDVWLLYDMLQAVGSSGKIRRKGLLATTDDGLVRLVRRVF